MLSFRNIMDKMSLDSLRIAHSKSLGNGTETAVSGVSFGVHLPCRTLPGGKSHSASYDLLVSMVDAAKATGCTSIWVTDHIIYPDPWVDCLLLLAAIAGRANERGLTIATGVVGLPLRHPVAMAQSFVTLDILSGGKLIIGVGEGSSRSDFAALGIPFEERRQMLEDGVVALRSLLTKTHVSHEGPFYRFHDVTISPRCVQRPCPPIWLSSWGAPAGMRRVARLGDGWIASAWHSTPEQFHSALDTLNAALIEQGRDPKSFPNAVDTMFMYIDPDRARARRVALPIIERAMRTPFDVGAGHCLVGDYSECQEVLHRWIEAGAQRICVWPLLEPVQQTTRFGEHILYGAANYKACAG